MAINFDQLPQENPMGDLPAPNVYRGKIVEAEMRQSKNDLTKPPYLNLKINLFDKDYKTAGTIYDIVSESDKSVVQYKLSRLLRACGIPLVGSMELKDLAKLVVNKEIALDINHDTPSDPKYKPKAQVDVFTREAYYLPAEFAEIYNLTNPDTPINTEVPFDTPQDGAPVAQPGTAEY